jgi:hypothetical protein
MGKIRGVVHSPVSGTYKILVYEPDLMFSSRIEAAAARVGASIEVANRIENLAEELKAGGVQGMLLNLDAAEGNLGRLESVLKVIPVKTVGYYSHTNTRLMEEARRAGIGSVLTRGAFVARLDVILKDVISSG